MSEELSPAREMWAADAASAMLGMEVDHLAHGEARVSMVVRPDMVNGHDLCHGGLIASLADSAFALACNSHGPVTVAAGFSVEFLAPGRLGQTVVRRCARGLAARPLGRVRRHGARRRPGGRRGHRRVPRPEPDDRAAAGLRQWSEGPLGRAWRSTVGALTVTGRGG